MCDCQCQTTTEEQPQTLAEVAREVTDNGRIIFEFLSDVVQGKMEGATLWHRLEATRQLRAFGVEIPQAVIEPLENAAKASEPRKQSTAPKRPASSRKNHEFAEIVKSETGNGRDVVRFLMDVMQGKLEGFKPYHRLMAAKELLKLALDNVPGLAAADDRHDSLYNHEDDPFDFDNYDEEEYFRDQDGERALRHIYGSEEAITVIREAVARHRQQASMDENYVPDRDFTPIEDPEDDPYGKGHYGYNALRFVFDDNQSIRVANRTFERFKEEEIEFGGCRDHDHPNWARRYAYRVILDSFEAEDRARSEQDQPQQDPDPNPPVTHEPSEQPPAPTEPPPTTPGQPDDPSVGEGFKPSRAHAHPSTGHNPDRPNVILERSEEPPGPPTEPNEKPPSRHRRKKPRRIIHLGPPDEEDPPDDNPRPYRDPDEIRIPLRDLVRFTGGPL